jgi:hypothetical protein
VKSIQSQVFSNPTKAVNILSMMSSEALKNLASDIKAQVNSGLMSDSEAHQSINLISGVLMNRECVDLLSRECADGHEKMY